MDLKTLNNFLVIAYEGSVTNAASKLFIAQPTLSRQLKALESELGTTLFERSREGMILTSSGERLRKDAIELLNMSHRIVREFSTESAEISGEVHISLGESRMARALAKAAKLMRASNPGIVVHLHTGTDYQDAVWLEEDYVDFAIFVQPANVSKYDHFTLPGSDRWGLLMHTDNPLSVKRAVRAADLAHEPLIVCEQPIRSSFGKNLFTDWLGASVEDFDFVTIADFPANAAFFVEEGLGSLFTFESLYNTSEGGALCFRPLEPELTSVSDLCWKKGQPLSPAAEIFFDAVRAVSSPPQDSDLGGSL